MNDKVKELVEWVARELCFIDGVKWDSIPDTTKTLFDGVVSKKQYKIRAKQILSHPDLALIDRDEMVATGSVVIGTKGERDYWLAGFKARGDICRKAVIPLSEAIKEKGEGSN